MLFNSYEFIFVFLPLTVAGYLLLGRSSRNWALGWLILASVAFYAYWRPFNLWIIGPSLLVNYAFARALLKLAGDEAKSKQRMATLALGVIFNICVLGYFKYANFAVNVANDVTGSNFVLENIILPLGISFITFQKIAFLVDIAGGRVKEFSKRDFLLFVMFFPQLIAGPIVHYREMMPQFQAVEPRFDAERFSLAISLFIFGLFKKVVLADGIAEYVSPVYAFAAAGNDPTFMQSWLAAVGYTLQIYFDFSGYSDMACGAALFFGVRLPTNFNSPLRSTNMIDFWLRWHITLTRFLTAYFYNPIALTLTRRRMAQKRAGLKARKSALPAFIKVLAFPTIATMLTSGIWHGAGYTFIIWGLLHGVYLVSNHAWRQYGPKPEAGKPAAPTAQLAGFVFTFLAVAVSMVFFRAPDVATAGNILAGMVGLNGLSLPPEIAQMLKTPQIPAMMTLAGEVTKGGFLLSIIWLAGLFGLAVLAPNSLEILSRYQPTLLGPKSTPKFMGVGPAVYWSPTLPWAIFIAALGAASVMRLTGASEFLYWQF